MNFQKPLSTRRTSLVIIFVIGLIYAAVLVSLPNDLFKDRGSYLEHAIHGLVVVQDQLGNGLKSFFFNEPVWFLYAFVVGSTFGAEFFVASTVFINSFILFVSLSLLVSRYRPGWISIIIALILVASPELLKNQLVHLRQGFALSIYLMWLVLSSKNVSIKASIFCSLVHSSFFFLSVFVLFFKLYRRCAPDLSAGVFILASIPALVGLFGTVDIFAEAVGARQAGKESIHEISGFGALFWLAYLFILTLRMDRLNEIVIFSALGIVVYLVGYLVFPEISRVFKNFIPYIYIVAFCGRTQADKVLLVLISINYIFHYLL